MEKNYKNELKKLKHINRKNNLLFSQREWLIKNSIYLIFILMGILCFFIVDYGVVYEFPYNIISWFFLFILSLPFSILIYYIVISFPSFNTKDDYLFYLVKNEYINHNWRNIYQIICFDKNQLLPVRIEKILLTLLSMKIAMIKNNTTIIDFINEKGIIEIKNGKCIRKESDLEKNK